MACISRRYQGEDWRGSGEQVLHSSLDLIPLSTVLSELFALSPVFRQLYIHLIPANNYGSPLS